MISSTMPTWTDFNREIKISEGVIPHLYLDTVGAVTVGVGNMLPNVAAAQQLRFVQRTTQAPANADEIAADFDAVRQQPKGKVAGAYKAHTKLDLPAAAIDELLDARIAGFQRELRSKFADFDRYPITAQFALVDMAFNLGTHGLVTKFPKFTKAVIAKDWATAAKESHRPQVQASRNATVRRWLEEAGGAAAVLP